MVEKRRQRLIALGALLALVAGYYAYQYIHSPATQPFDPLIEGAIEQAAQISSYAQYVETSQLSEGGPLQINGEYLVDDSNRNYASYSTTTYTQTRGSPVVFLLENRTIGSDIYVRVLSKSPAVRLSVPANGVWQHFSANNIPSAYQNIAVVGPIIDSLKLLDRHGEYLVHEKNHGMTSFKNIPYIRYTLRLSRLAETAKDPGVRTIAGRIGMHGLVDIWIDPSDASIGYLRLTDGISYTSTTTFSRFNESLDITAPLSQ